MGLEAYADAIIAFVKEHKAWAGPASTPETNCPPPTA